MQASYGASLRTATATTTGQSHSHLVARLSDAQEQLAGAHSDLAALQLRVQEQQQHYDQLHSSYLVLEQQLQATQTMLWGNIRQLQQELQQAITEKQQLQAVRAAGRGRGPPPGLQEQGSPVTWLLCFLQLGFSRWHANLIMD